MNQITIQLINGLAGVSVDFLKPLFDVVKGLPVCHVVYHNDAMWLMITSETKSDTRC